MNSFILLIIAAFQLLNNAIADWGLHSPLILTSVSTNDVINIPSVVRWSDQFQCSVYYSDEHKGTAVTYQYCPRLNDGNEYCNYATDFYDRDYLEKKRLSKTCKLPVLYRRKPILDRKGYQENCRHDQRTGSEYKFEYLLCHNRKENEKIRIYEMCYQDNLKGIILGSYDIETPRLLAEPLLQDEQNYVFQVFHTDHYPDNDFIHWNILYQGNPNFKARSVLPHEWVPFGPQKKPLFDYMNAAPMLTSLVEGWETLMRNMKLKLSRMNEAIRVTAGLLDVSTDPDYQPDYLGYMPQIKAPYGWWVLIYNQNRTAGVAIIMHNKMFQVHEGDANMTYYDSDNNICSHDVCHLANIADIIPIGGIHFMYCCRPNFIVDKFNLYAYGTNVLKFPIA